MQWNGSSGMSLRNCRDLQRLKKIDASALADELRMSVAKFRAWVRKGDARYNAPKIDFSTGKKRVFDVPFYRDRRRFRAINKFLQRVHSHHRCAHGGITKRSSVSSALRHVGNRFIWTTDVKDCFLSISNDIFNSQLKQLGLCDSQVELLARLFLCRNRLPQGSPTSNAALNIFFWHLDYRMVEYCGKRKLCYTRMADDIVISGRKEEAGESASRKLHAMIAEADLNVNLSKWEKLGRQSSPEHTLIHSLNVARGILELSSVQQSHAKTVANRTIGACRSLQISSFESAVGYRNQLHGWYHYARQTQDSITQELRIAISQSDQLVRQRLENEHISVKGWKWWVHPHCKQVARLWQKRNDCKVVDKIAQQELEVAQ